MAKLMRRLKKNKQIMNEQLRSGVKVKGLKFKPYSMNKIVNDRIPVYTNLDAALRDLHPDYNNYSYFKKRRAENELRSLLEMENSIYHPKYNAVFLGKGQQGDKRVLAHELGHAVDFLDTGSSAKERMKERNPLRPKNLYKILTDPEHQT